MISTFTTAPSSSGKRNRRELAARPLSVDAEFFAQFRSQLVARRNRHFVKDARVVGKHDVAVRPVAKESDERRMLALDDLHDAAFGASVGAAALDSRENAIAVHRVRHVIASDKKIAFDAWDRLVRHHEAVAVAMRNNSTGNKIRIVASPGRRARRPCCWAAFARLHLRRCCASRRRSPALRRSAHRMFCFREPDIARREFLRCRRGFLSAE